MRYREHLMENVSLRGVTREYMNFANYTLEKGRLISPTEIDRNRPGGAARLGRRGPALQGDRPDRQAGQHRRAFTSASSGVAEKKGSFFGAGQDEYAIVPIGALRHFFGGRQSLMLTVKPVHPVADEGGDGGHARGDARAPPAEAEAEGQLRHVQLGDAS